MNEPQINMQGEKLGETIFIFNAALKTFEGNPSITISLFYRHFIFKLAKLNYNTHILLVILNYHIPGYLYTLLSSFPICGL